MTSYTYTCSRGGERTAEKFSGKQSFERLHVPASEHHGTPRAHMRAPSSSSMSRPFLKHPRLRVYPQDPGVISRPCVRWPVRSPQRRQHKISPAYIASLHQCTRDFPLPLISACGWTSGMEANFDFPHVFPPPIHKSPMDIAKYTLRSRRPREPLHASMKSWT